ncbi:hypothetical protein [Paenibacillus thiaminolyticus]|uniref:hypothetical protein n=1 Tax=Paenibacillus thiaminolyticus TaxID=49283 RepID=UPI0015FF18C1|nr:hypothetical protein [Paenibacillus thiaminolyticus]
MKYFAILRHAVRQVQPRQKEWTKVYSGLVQPGDAFVFDCRPRSSHRRRHEASIFGE